MAHVSHCGKIRLIICRHIEWLDLLSIQCAYQAVSISNELSVLPDTAPVETQYNEYQLQLNKFPSFRIDHTQVVGFSYDSSEAAHEIWTGIERLISDPENISLSVPGRKRKQQKRPKPAAPVQKSQISQPCQFSHVTSVTTNDTHRYFSLQTFVAQPINHPEH